MYIQAEPLVFEDRDLWPQRTRPFGLCVPAQLLGGLSVAGLHVWHGGPGSLGEAQLRAEH